MDVFFLITYESCVLDGYGIINAPFASKRITQGCSKVKGVRKGRGWVNPPLELDILQKNYYLRKEINCFRILFAC